MKQINFRVSEQQYEMLRNKAAELGVKTVPELCKQYVVNRDETYLEDRRSYQMIIRLRRLLNQCDLSEDTLQKINEEFDTLWHT